MLMPFCHDPHATIARDVEPFCFQRTGGRCFAIRVDCLETFHHVTLFSLDGTETVARLVRVSRKHSHQSKKRLPISKRIRHPTIAVSAITYASHRIASYRTAPPPPNHLPVSPLTGLQKNKKMNQGCACGGQRSRRLLPHGPPRSVLIPDRHRTSTIATTPDGNNNNNSRTERRRQLHRSFLLGCARSKTNRPWRGGGRSNLRYYRRVPLGGPTRIPFPRKLQQSSQGRLLLLPRWP